MTITEAQLDICRVHARIDPGKIVEMWEDCDEYGMPMQLGLIQLFATEFTIGTASRLQERQALRPIYKDGGRTFTIVQVEQTDDRGAYPNFSQIFCRHGVNCRTVM
jgi:hypothetical protein